MKNFSSRYNRGRNLRPPDLYEYFGDNFWFKTIDLENQKMNEPLRGSHKADVAIVGGGYTGLSAAYHITRKFPESNEVFPYLTMQEIDIGYALVKALRVSYVGELGWELYVPTEFALHVYDLLMEAGEAVGLKLAGLQALDTLRMEKSYRDYGNDIDNMDTPLEAGLGFFVKFDKPGGFIGREALLRQKEEGIKQRFVQFLLQGPEPLLHGNEPIYRDGVCVGYIRAGGYGHTLGGAVGLGFVENEAGITPDYITSGSYEIEIAGVRYPAKASLRPMYDPKGERVRS